MTTITPPTAPQPPPSTPSTAPVVVVQSPPAALARLAIGQLLEATVTAQTGKDVVQVQTPLGQLSVQSVIALPKGSALVLQLQSQSPFFQFQVNSLNGNPPPHILKKANAAILSPGTAERATGTTANQGQTATAPKLTPGSVLQATVMRPLSQAITASANTTASLTGAGTATDVIKGGVGAQASATQGLSKQAPLTAATTGKQTARATTPSHNNPASAPATVKVPSGVLSKAPGYLPPGSQLSVKISSVQLPNPAAASTSPAAPAGPGANPTLSAGSSLSGSVTGSTPSGHPIVQTRAGVFALTTQTVVPRGSVVTFEVVNTPSPPLIKPGAAPMLHESLFISRKWPALEQVVQVLHEVNPATAQQLVNTILPRPDAGLTSGLIFFLTALRGGDLLSLIGEAPLRMIERNRPNLAGRMTEDFTALSRIADEPGPGDWRVALIPINTGAEIEQIRLLMRQHAGEEGEDAGPADGRFVVDVELTSLGRLQLDGLVRNNGKSLDLIIRSEKPLSETMHNDIRTIFLDAADLTGLKGGVNFQAAPANFIDIADPLGDHALGLLV
ncbi:MAG: hypothetical protein ISR46_03275 [Rhodospirillales bacterium]|nr:hypothetical protein [Rhodospirillales bacterium]